MLGLLSEFEPFEMSFMDEEPKIQEPNDIQEPDEPYAGFTAM